MFWDLVVNWILGFYSRNFTTKKWFPFKGRQIENSSKWFDKFGKWSLLFAWVPSYWRSINISSRIIKG